MSAAVGTCDFTADPLHHSMVEVPPSLAFEGIQEPSSLDLAAVLSLGDHFFLACSGILDFCERPFLFPLAVC
jgi:hypothetical protein